MNRPSLHLLLLTASLNAIAVPVHAQTSATGGDTPAPSSPPDAGANPDAEPASASDKTKESAATGSDDKSEEKADSENGEDGEDGEAEDVTPEDTGGDDDTDTGNVIGENAGNLALPPLRRVRADKPDNAIIGTATVIVDRPKRDEERQLSSYLIRFIGRPATPENLAAIEEWLLRLERYRAAVCRFSGKGRARMVRCGITRAPTIRSVTLEGLPATLLEADVMRRVFLRPGEVLDDKDERGKTRIVRQQDRLERFLERKGLYGANVRILSPPVSKSSEVDVVIRISGGSFVKVRSVLARNALPFTREYVVGIFTSMCSGEGLLEGFETLHLACFTKERTRAVTDALENELRKRGYPEGRIRVRPSFVGIDDDPNNGIVARARRDARRNIAKPGVADSLPFVADRGVRPNEGNSGDNQGTPSDDATADEKVREARANLNVPGVGKKAAAVERALTLPMTEECRPLKPARKGDDLVPRCVDLAVDLNPGPHLVTEIDVIGQPKVNPYTTDPFAALNPDLNGIRNFIQGTWRVFTGALVAPSRMVQLGVNRPLRTAAGTQIDRDELEAALTFNEARSADQTEAYVSAQSLRFALQRRGYFFAGVWPSFSAEGDRVDVTFEVDPGDPIAVSRVIFHGNDSYSESDIRSEIDFASKERRALASGFVTQLDLEDDRRRLLSFYESHGFVEANVEVDAVRINRDQVEIHFRISEGARWHVDSVVLQGVPPALTDEVVRTLEHCKNGIAGKEGRVPLVPGDCAGSPFRPSDSDALALERQRVLNVFVSEGFPYATAEVFPADFKPNGGVVLKVAVQPAGKANAAAPAKEPLSSSTSTEAAIASGKSPVGEASDDADDQDMVNLPSANDDDAEGRVRLGEIFIDGNHISDRDVMMRELSITNDKVLRPRKIAEGVSRLRRTGLYSRVELEFIGIEEQSDRVHLLIQVEERPTVTVDTSVGFSTDRLFGWRLEARDRNFYGSMFDVSGLLDFGLFIGRYTNAQAQVRWPRILGSRVDLRFTPSFVYEDRPSSDIPRVPVSDDPQLAVGVWTVDQFRRRQARIGQVIGVEVQPFAKSKVLTLSLDLEQRLEWTDNLAKPISPFSLEAVQTIDGMTLAFQQCVLPVSTVTPKVSLRELDNPFDPKFGYALEGSVMLGHPIVGVSCTADGSGGLNDLDVLGEWVGLLSASATGYYTVGRFTLAGNIRGWTGVARSEDRFFQSSLIRNQSLLAVGGDRSVRGFNQDDIGLKAYGARPEEGVAVFDEDNLLSLSGAVFNLELRTTLLPNFFIGDLNGAAFIDVGLVTDTLNLPWFSPRQMWSQLSSPNGDYLDPRLGVGVGVGLRYVLPVGPISADIAIRPDPLVDAAFGFTPRGPAFDVHFQLGYVF